jgi:hypothetical protein
LQSISRTYQILNIILGKDAHSNRVAVPWREIGLDQKKFIDSKYIPDKVVIQDPSHMQSSEIRTLCARIIWLQNRGDPAFRFRSVLLNHRGKGSTQKKWQDLMRSSSSGDEGEFSRSVSETESEQEEQEEQSEQQEEMEQECETEQEDNEVEEKIAPKPAKGKRPVSAKSWQVVL